MAKDGKSTLAVSVGGVAFKCNNSESVSLTTTATEYEFKGSASGDIVISYAQPSNTVKAVYLAGISVAWDTAKKLGNILATWGETALEENGEYTMKEGDVLNFSCENASSITVVGEEGGNLAQGTDKCSWTATPIELDALTVTATDGTATKTLSFFVTVEKKEVLPAVAPTISFKGEEKNQTFVYYVQPVTAAIASTECAAISYTIDGTDPATSATALLVDGKEASTAELPVGTVTIRAIALNANGDASEETTATVMVKMEPGLAWSAETASALLGDENPTLPTLVNPNNLPVTYSSSKPEVATVDAGGNVTIAGLGTTAIRATYLTTEESEFADTWKEYTLTVTDPGAISFETSYMFDFTIEGNYGLTPYESGTSYEPDSENPVNDIVSGDVTLHFNVESLKPGANSYRQYQGSNQLFDMRVYGGVDFVFTVPEGGVITKVVFSRAQDNGFGFMDEECWNNLKASGEYIDETNLKTCDHFSAKLFNKNSVKEITWTAPEGKLSNKVVFHCYKKTFIAGVTVYYDMGKPAMPYVVSEDANEVVVACQKSCVLHYIKKPSQGASAPARVAFAGEINDTDAWYRHDSDTPYTITLDKNNADHTNRGYLFKAVHEGSGLESNVLGLSLSTEGTLTGIENVDAEAAADAPAEYYDLQGRRVANPAKGLYIRRQGAKVEKVML